MTLDISTLLSYLPTIMNSQGSAGSTANNDLGNASYTMNLGGTNGTQDYSNLGTNFGGNGTNALPMAASAPGDSSGGGGGMSMMPLMMLMVVLLTSVLGDNSKSSSTDSSNTPPANTPPENSPPANSPPANSPPAATPLDDFNQFITKADTNNDGQITKNEAQTELDSLQKDSQASTPAFQKLINAGKTLVNNFSAFQNGDQIAKLAGQDVKADTNLGVDDTKVSDIAALDGEAGVSHADLKAANDDLAKLPPAPAPQTDNFNTQDVVNFVKSQDGGNVTKEDLQNYVKNADPATEADQYNLGMANFLLSNSEPLSSSTSNKITQSSIKDAAGKDGDATQLSKTDIRDGQADAYASLISDQSGTVKDADVAGLKQVIQNADTNHDGIATKKELQDYLTKLSGQNKLQADDSTQQQINNTEILLGDFNQFADAGKSDQIGLTADDVDKMAAQGKDNTQVTLGDLDQANNNLDARGALTLDGAQREANVNNTANNAQSSLNTNDAVSFIQQLSKATGKNYVNKQDLQDFLDGNDANNSQFPAVSLDNKRIAQFFVNNYDAASWKQDSLDSLGPQNSPIDQGISASDVGELAALDGNGNRINESDMNYSSKITFESLYLQPPGPGSTSATWNGQPVDASVFKQVLSDVDKTVNNGDGTGPVTQDELKQYIQSQVAQPFSNLLNNPFQAIQDGMQGQKNIQVAEFLEGNFNIVQAASGDTKSSDGITAKNIDDLAAASKTDPNTNAVTRWDMDAVVNKMGTAATTDAKVRENQIDNDVLNTYTNDLQQQLQNLQNLQAQQFSFNTTDVTNFIDQFGGTSVTKAALQSYFDNASNGYSPLPNQPDRTPTNFVIARTLLENFDTLATQPPADGSNTPAPPEVISDATVQQFSGKDGDTTTFTASDLGVSSDSGGSSDFSGLFASLLSALQNNAANGSDILSALGLGGSGTSGTGQTSGGASTGNTPPAATITTNADGTVSMSNGVFSLDGIDPNKVYNRTTSRDIPLVSDSDGNKLNAELSAYLPSQTATQAVADLGLVNFTTTDANGNTDTYTIEAWKNPTTGSTNGPLFIQDSNNTIAGTDTLSSPLQLPNATIARNADGSIKITTKNGESYTITSNNDSVGSLTITANNPQGTADALSNISLG